MTSERTKKEPWNYRALIERKLSQQRVKKLLQLSIVLSNVSQTAEDEKTLELYEEASDSIDRLIIAEAKYQKRTMQSDPSEEGGRP